MWHIYFYFSGLRKGDLLNEDDPDVIEAIKRLPSEEFNLRQFRVKRALDLSMKHQILPKDQWTTKEEVNFTLIFDLVIDHLKESFLTSLFTFFLINIQLCAAKASC